MIARSARLDLGLLTTEFLRAALAGNPVRATRSSAISITAS
jgi:hypothetical protein